MSMKRSILSPYLPLMSLFVFGLMLSACQPPLPERPNPTPTTYQLDPAGRVQCVPDPIPSKVFSTPVMLRDKSGSPQNHVVVWTDKFPGTDANSTDPTATHYLTRFYNTSSGTRTCEVETETSLGEPRVPWEGATMSSFVAGAGSGTPEYVSWGLHGAFERYAVQTNGLIAPPSTYSYNLTNTPDMAGADMGGWMDETNADPLIFIENLCFPNIDCTNDLGRLYALDVNNGTVLDALDLNAWGTGVNGITNTFNGDQILMVQGTCGSSCGANSTNGQCSDPNDIAYNPDYDCEMISVSYDPLQGTLNLIDRLDDGNRACNITKNGGVGDCVQEPVPFNEDKIIALRTRGSVEIVNLNRIGGLERDCEVVWDDGVHTFTHPPEHALSLGQYPGSNVQTAMFGVNYKADYRDPGAYIVALDDPDGFCIDTSKCDSWAPDTRKCSIDPAQYAIGQIEGNSPVWGSGATALYTRFSGEQALAYVIATNAHTVPGNKPATNTPPVQQCSPGDTPPQLSIFFFNPNTMAWIRHTINLASNRSNQSCWEYAQQNFGSEAWESIKVIGGVTVIDDAVYVATTDGSFWEYSTATGGYGGWTLSGLYGDWPRFKKNNQGTGRAY